MEKGYQVDRKVIIELIKKSLSSIKEIHSVKDGLFRKGIKIRKWEGGMEISLELMVKGGSFIPQVVEETQKKIKEGVEKILGISVTKVDIRIKGIKFSQ